MLILYNVFEKQYLGRRNTKITPYTKRKNTIIFCSFNSNPGQAPALH